MKVRNEMVTVMNMENRMMEYATTNTQRPPAMTASRRTHVCDTCHAADADCSRVVREYHRREVRLLLCQPCLKRHVIQRQDRARLDTATEARMALDATAARRAARPTSTASTAGGWRGQLDGLRRAMPARTVAVRR